MMRDGSELPRLVTAALMAAVLMAALLVACTDDEDPSAEPPSSTETQVTSESLSQDDAIEIARSELEGTFPEYDLSGREPNVLVKGENYEVSFPVLDEAVATGEPHIVINRQTGEIVERFLTR